MGIELFTDGKERLNDEKLKLLEDCIAMNREDGEYDLIYDKFLFENAIKETCDYIDYSLTTCNEVFIESYRNRLLQLIDAFSTANYHFKRGVERGKIDQKYFGEWLVFYRATLNWILDITRIFKNSINEIKKLTPWSEG